MRASGRLRVANGDNWCARRLARLLRLPDAGDAVDTRLVVEPCEGGERWLRTFGGRPLNSRQYARAGCDVAERFGLVELRFMRDRSDGSTRYRQAGASLVAGPLRIPLPRACAPAVVACEYRESHRLFVDVRVAVPLVGTLLTYDGTIDVDESST